TEITVRDADMIQHHQPFAALEWQWAQHCRVNRAEHCGCRTYSHCEHQNYGYCERGTHYELAACITQVQQKCVHALYSPVVALTGVVLRGAPASESTDGAESGTCKPERLVRRISRRLQVPRRLFQVEAQFVLDVRVHVGTPEPEVASPAGCVIHGKTPIRSRKARQPARASLRGKSATRWMHPDADAACPPESGCRTAPDAYGR